MDSIFWILFGIFVFLFICFITYLIYSFIKEKSLIKKGELDNEISLESKKEEKKSIFDIVLSIINYVVVGIVIVLFGFSLLSRITSSYKAPFQFTTIASNSMASVNKQNKYIDENNLNNKLYKYDVVFLTKVNSLEDLKLYDIVSYKSNEINIIHRIVEIHDDYLILKGDANDQVDPIKVNLEMINGKYSNFRIPYLGFVVFYLRSNYGILAVSLIFSSYIAYSVEESLIEKEKRARLKKTEVTK